MINIFIKINLPLRTVIIMIKSDENNNDSDININ